MKLPTAFRPPPTPVKKRLSVDSTCSASRKHVAEGSFYKIYLTEHGTVLRVSKQPSESLEEVRILRALDHPFINRMIGWTVEGGGLCFEMEKCDFNLKERDDRIEKFFRGDWEANVEKRPRKATDVSSSPLFSSSEELDCPDNSFISDPFSNTLVPCSTSLILSDDSSSSEGVPATTETALAPLWVRVMMFQLGSALAYIHSKRIVHMDVKPENILVKIADKHITFQLCDFNISRVGEGHFVLDGDKVYMAPEILRNRCFFKSDVFSLGLLYLELLNERALPTSGEEYRRLRKNDFGGWKIDEIGRQMLERNPTARCTAKDVEDYFGKLIGG